MQIRGQQGANPLAELCRLTGQESLQAGCRWLEHKATGNGGFHVQSSAKPTDGQPGEAELRMNRQPKKSGQDRPQDESTSSEWTIKPPVGIRCLRDRKLELLRNTTPGKESGRSGPCSGAIEPGPERAQELGFPGQRR